MNLGRCAYIVGARRLLKCRVTSLNCLQPSLALVKCGRSLETSVLTLQVEPGGSRAMGLARGIRLALADDITDTRDTKPLHRWIPLLRKNDLSVPKLSQKPGVAL